MKKAPKSKMTKLAEAAFREASRDVIERARQAGTKLIIWKDGAVRKVDPFDVKLGPKPK